MRHFVISSNYKNENYSRGVEKPGQEKIQYPPGKYIDEITDCKKHKNEITKRKKKYTIEKQAAT